MTQGRARRTAAAAVARGKRGAQPEERRRDQGDFNIASNPQRAARLLLRLRLRRRRRLPPSEQAPPPSQAKAGAGLATRLWRSNQHARRDNNNNVKTMLSLLLRRLARRISPAGTRCGLLCAVVPPPPPRWSSSSSTGARGPCSAPLAPASSKTASFFRPFSLPPSLPLSLAAAAMASAAAPPAEDDDPQAQAAFWREPGNVRRAREELEREDPPPSAALGTGGCWPLRPPLSFSRLLLLLPLRRFSPRVGARPWRCGPPCCRPPRAVPRMVRRCRAAWRQW